ncbi:23S rRNA (uracil-5-)-methyltransferase RumA, partial [Staphylococcus aureus]|nr:23S rRNA (uracil-5-)-methyltransferase RumA [Staphylococcus aureus]
GKLLQVVKPSEHRVEPPCKYYWKCGGCQLQHMTYEAQLAMKQSQVINLFHRKAQFTDTTIHKTVGMDNPWQYRNKSQLPIGTDKNGQA